MLVLCLLAQLRSLHSDVSTSEQPDNCTYPKNKLTSQTDELSGVCGISSKVQWEMGQVKAYNLMQNPKIRLHNSNELGNVFVPLFFVYVVFCFFCAPTNCHDGIAVNISEKALPSSGKPDNEHVKE